MANERIGLKDRDTDKWTFVMKIFAGVVAAIIINGIVSYEAVQRASFSNSILFSEHTSQADKFATSVIGRLNDHDARIRQVEQSWPVVDERTRTIASDVRDIKRKIDNFAPVVDRTDRHLDRMDHK